MRVYPVTECLIYTVSDVVDQYIDGILYSCWFQVRINYFRCSSTVLIRRNSNFAFIFL